MVLLLLLALGARGAAAFMVHMGSSCSLAANGSATDFAFSLVFNKKPLVCYEPHARRFVACDYGLLQAVAAQLAAGLNNGSAWIQRAQSRQRACAQLGTRFWASTALRSTSPRARIVPWPSDTSILLTCHVWGFYPPELTVLWLHNGAVLEPEAPSSVSAVPNGDGTYQTRVALRLVAPRAGDTFTCAVQHQSLAQPLLEDWSPGLSPGLALKVAAAAVLMALGLGSFIAGFCRYRARPAAPGYTPLPGDNYPAGST
ncbi:HLA class II histocompatibility antigen, DM beta chain isoform X1 [Colius striatus]|uniref:HLA class II histocompatibility antigen, DM beta chain isoform X1 n=1 Tax=Colius striatus TaxID=57412 RepID=UPI002B1D79DA|nr:HLA class II histocompatibility antigen, DM beta chain isoform X1 [Colius striatus]